MGDRLPRLLRLPTIQSFFAIHKYATTLMTLPLPIHHFRERILLAQQDLNGNVTRSLINKRSLLLLSRPVQQLNNALIMDFFGVYWIVTTLGPLGFFADLDEAVRYIVSGSTQPNECSMLQDS